MLTSNLVYYFILIIFVHYLYLDKRVALYIVLVIGFGYVLNIRHLLDRLAERTFYYLRRTVVYH